MMRLKNISVIVPLAPKVASQAELNDSTNFEGHTVHTYTSVLDV
jgi:hypothetical protein